MNDKQRLMADIEMLEKLMESTVPSKDGPPSGTPLPSSGFSQVQLDPADMKTSAAPAPAARSGRSLYLAAASLVVLGGIGAGAAYWRQASAPADVATVSTENEAADSLQIGVGDAVSPRDQAEAAPEMEAAAPQQDASAELRAADRESAQEAAPSPDAKLATLPEPAAAEPVARTPAPPPVPQEANSKPAAPLPEDALSSSKAAAPMTAPAPAPKTLGDLAAEKPKAKAPAPAKAKQAKRPPPPSAKTAKTTPAQPDAAVAARAPTPQAIAEPPPPPSSAPSSPGYLQRAQNAASSLLGSVKGIVGMDGGAR